MGKAIAILVLATLMIAPMTGCAYQLGYAAGTVVRTVTNTLPFDGGSQITP